MEESAVNVQFKIEGPVFKKGIPLLEVTSALQEFHFILDKSYLIKTGQFKMSSKERKTFTIVATDLRKGSFVADLQLLLFLSSPFLPTVYEFKAKELWEISKSAYDYLKALFTMRSSGVEPKIKVEGDNYAPVINNEGGGTIIVNNIVYNAADKAEPHFKKLTSNIKEGKTDFISALDQDEKGFILTPKERDLFNPKTQMEKDVLTLEVDIFRYDKDSNTGKLRVNEGAAIPPGDYSFKPIKHDPISFIFSMAKPPVVVNVLKEIEKHASGVTRISRLHIVSIENIVSAQGQLF